MVCVRTVTKNNTFGSNCGPTGQRISKIIIWYILSRNQKKNTLFYAIGNFKKNHNYLKHNLVFLFASTNFIYDLYIIIFVI